MIITIKRNKYEVANMSFATFVSLTGKGRKEYERLGGKEKEVKPKIKHKAIKKAQEEEKKEKGGED